MFHQRGQQGRLNDSLGLALVASCLVCSVVPSAAGQIRWRSAEPDYLAAMGAREIGETIKDLVGFEAGRHIIVQFSGPPTAAVRAALAGGARSNMAPWKRSGSRSSANQA